MKTSSLLITLAIAPLFVFSNFSFGATNDKKAIREAGGTYTGKFKDGILKQTDTGSDETEIFKVTERGKLKIPKSEGRARTVAKEKGGDRDRLPATGKSDIMVRRNGKKVLYDVKQVKFDNYKGDLKGKSIKRGSGFQATGKLKAKRNTEFNKEVLKGTVQGKD